MQRDVGVGEHLVAVGKAPVRDGDADAGGARDLVIGDLDRLRDRGEQSGGRVEGRLGATALEEDDELVAGEARDQVFGPDRLAQPLGHGAEQPVAGAVAE